MVGIAFYASIALLLGRQKPMVERLAGLGALASAGLLAYQWAVLQAFCLYCSLSALCCFGLFALRRRQSQFSARDWALTAAAATVLTVFPYPRKPLPDLRGCAQHSRGRPDAAERLVLISDFRCPHCADLYQKIRERTNSHLTSVVFPLAYLVDSEDAAAAALAAGEQDRYWQYADLLYANVKQPLQLTKWAEDLKLDVSKFESDRQRLRGQAVQCRQRLAPQLRTLPSLYRNGQQISVRELGP